MKIKKLVNISENKIDIRLVSGGVIKLPPKGILEDIEVTDVSGIAKWTKITYDLSEVNP